jgi:L-ascorbate metabolism protein UlaG (beta-lactamase superfamily)
VTCGAATPTAKGLEEVTAILDWAGCATFRLVIGDLVVFLDAYLDRSPAAVPTGFSADAVERADWILVGHSHADHLWGAERIAARTGATIVGSYETARVMSALGVPESQLACVSGGERLRLGGHATVRVFPGLHSCVWAESAPDAATVCLGDLGVDWHQRRSRMDAGLAGLAGLAEGNPGVRDYVASHNALASRGDGGALAYLIETPEGSLFYTDTAGYWAPVLGRLRPDVAILGAAGRGNVDGEPVQGSLAGFIAREAELLRPARLLLGHHDDWMPGLTSALDITPVREALAERTPGAELVEIGYRSGYPLFASTRRVSTTKTGGGHE